MSHLAVAERADGNGNLCESGALTEREQKIVQLIATGYKNLQIGRELATTQQVIKNYVRVILNKLGFDNRLEISLWQLKREMQRTELCINENSVLRASMPTRWREMCDGLCEGLCQKEIAERSGIGIQTVKHHLASLYRFFEIPENTVKHVALVAGLVRIGYMV